MARTQEQIHTIQQLFGTHTYREIAEVVGMPYNTMRKRVVEMQDNGDVPLKRPRWSDDEERILASMVDAGRSDAEIAIRLNRSARSVIERRRAIQR